MPLRKRGRTIPASCADLDLEGVGRELTRVSGNVGKAAKTFGVPTRDLRLLVYAQPELLDAALEAEEEAIDAAQALLFAALRGGAHDQADQGCGSFSARGCCRAAAWLRVGAMRDHAHTLSDFRVPTLSIECEPCGRFGRYNVARLIEKYGDAKLPELRHISPTAPRRRLSASTTGARSGYGEDSRLG